MKSLLPPLHGFWGLNSDCRLAQLLSTELLPETLDPVPSPACFGIWGPVWCSLSSESFQAELELLKSVCVLV